jgi:osmotically-inducible protein OsmY
MPPMPSRLSLARILVIALALAALCLATACREDSREAKLRDAQRELAAAEAELEEARTNLTAKTEALAAAQQAHDEARAAVRQAEARVEAARSEVGVFATDDVLFRTVQTALLEDDRLRDVAIAASVSDGRVTLSGDVPESRLRDRAVELAKKVPGVTEVTSEIRVVRPDASGSESRRETPRQELRSDPDEQES